MPQPQDAADQIVAAQKPTPFVPASLPAQITPPQNNKANPVLEGADLGAQLYDGINTIRGINQFGQHEMNPIAAPFTHGGLPMMVLGGAAVDAFKNLLLRHASAGTKNTVNAADLLGHLYGIMVTNHNRAGGGGGWGI